MCTLYCVNYNVTCCTCVCRRAAVKDSVSHSGLPAEDRSARQSRVTIVMG